MAEQKHSKSKASHKVALGAGIATIAAAAAGAYFLYGTKEGAKRRKQISGWMLKMKGEVLEKMEVMEDISEVAYHDIVDAVAKSYKNIKNVEPKEVTALAEELKKHWKNIKKHLLGANKKSKK